MINVRKRRQLARSQSLTLLNNIYKRTVDFIWRSGGWGEVFHSNEQTKKRVFPLSHVNKFDLNARARCALVRAAAQPYRFQEFGANI